MNESRQAIYMTRCMDDQVCNGGFNRYFYNPSGAFAHLTPFGLKLIGANRLADLLSRAIRLFYAQHEVITEHQDGTLQGFSDSYKDNPLNDLDSEYYDICKLEDLEKLQVAFIRSHKADFVDA